jgi:hypothetical protein
MVLRLAEEYNLHFDEDFVEAVIEETITEMFSLPGSYPVLAYWKPSSETSCFAFPITSCGSPLPISHLLILSPRPAEAERVIGQIFAILLSSLAKVVITKSRFPATGTGSILLRIRFSKSDCGQHSTPEERPASGATGGAQPLAIVTNKPRRWQFDFVVTCNIIKVSVECDTIAVLIGVLFAEEGSMKDWQPTPSLGTIP